jgi:hypothetical protein
VAAPRPPRADPPPRIDAAPRPVAVAEVRAFLDRWAAAWRAHDVGTLRALGQVRTEAQANALRGYFATARDLDVEVNLLDVRPAADGATVRFTRRDRFRDPTGRLVLKESPPIEKEIVRDGRRLRFASSS